MDFIHVRVLLQETLLVFRFRPRFRLPLSAHSLRAMPYGYHLSAPLSAITIGFPLSAPLSVYRFRTITRGLFLSAFTFRLRFRLSPSALQSVFLSAPLSVYRSRTITSQLFLRLSPFGPAFGVPPLVMLYWL